MKYGKRLIKLSWVILLMVINILSFSIHSQSYSCEFEDDKENSRWVLNTGKDGSNCANRWYIGAPGNNGGAKGLYISGDDGATASYVGTSTFVAVYRTITLPVGTYELSFDWQALGNENDGIYVTWIADTESTNSVASGYKPKWLTDNPLVVDNSVLLYNEEWHSARAVVTSDGTPHKLVFSWLNASHANSPAACIDNINIIPDKACVMSDYLDLQVTDTASVNIKWKKTKSGLYDVRMLASDGVWRTFDGVTDNMLTVDNIPEGGVSVYVRSRCDDFRSAYVSGNVFMFHKGARCIDYLDLDASCCYSGTYKNPYSIKYKVDAGYKSINSRHTVHWNMIERDPRTDLQLRTVPDGEIASVRLGNWDTGSQAEAIEYAYHVDEKESAILLLQYAVVLQNPRHDISAQPRFTLDILHNDGSMIDEYGCGNADFFAGINTEGWDSVGSGSNIVLWKDWTTVGINLRDYAGQDLIIRLTSYDCNEGGHYGYAYFVLGCSDGKILGLSCGESEKNSFMAPDGFLYRWYEKKDPDKKTIDSTRIFTTHRTDTVIYCCDVIQPTKGECYYTVEVNATPRYPVADMQYELSDNRCHNIVTFEDISYIMHVNPFTNDTTISVEKCDSVIWDFGDGTLESRDDNPVHVYPDNGGRFTVTMKAYIVECENIRTFEIVLPQSGTAVDSVYTVSCNGTGVEFGGEVLYKEGWYTDTIVNYNGEGCDSIIVMYLTESYSYDTVFYDTVCSGFLPYIFRNNEYNATGVYSDTLQTVYGCDSVVTLNLVVDDALELTMCETLSVCIDDGEIYFPVDVVQGDFSTISFVFDGVDDIMTVSEMADDGITVPLPENILPGEYRMEVTFEDVGKCGDVTKDMTVNVLYPDSIITQRWNDVLGVRSALWNGGYEFVAYQWYKDGVPMSGKIGANLYLPDGFDTNALYSVMLTRIHDGVTAMTCAIQPQWFDDLDILPTVTFGSGHILLACRENAVARIWSVTGVLTSVHEIVAGENYIALPNVNGTYLIELIFDDGSVRIEKIVVCGNK